MVEYFDAGNALDVGDTLDTDTCLTRLADIRDFRKQIDTLAGELAPEILAGPADDELRVSIAEFILEGLHCHNRVNKQRKSGGAVYRLLWVVYGGVVDV